MPEPKSFNYKINEAMQEKGFQKFYDLLVQRSYRVFEKRYETSSGSWYIIFKSKWTTFRITWKGYGECIFEERKKLIFWQTIFATSNTRWTPEDLLFRIENNPFFHKTKGHEPLRRKYPRLSENLKEKLNRITPSKDGHVAYYPCKVTLKNLKTVDFVYISSSYDFIETGCTWPDLYEEGKEIKIEDVLDLEESPSRMPADLASKLYKSGETGMGYFVFTILFKDGLTLPVITPYHLDFVDYPEGKTRADIKDILPHKGRDNPDLKKGPDYYWCFYD